MSRSLRIIVADDEPDVREYFCRLLPRMGHTVLAAASTGAELIQYCEAHSPDLVIADVRMPEMQGDEAIRTICQRRPVPFILVSAYHADFDEADWSRRWGLYLDKPVTKTQLAKAIEQLTEGMETP